MRDVLLLLALLLLPGLALWRGAPGPLVLPLNFGPGDGPYLQGFEPLYEIDDRLATHWSHYDAAVHFPLAVEGPVEVTARFARVFPQTAAVQLSLGERVIDRFQARGGAFVERTVRAGTVARTPLRVGIVSDSHEGRDRGLKLDWLRVEVGKGGRVRLLDDWARLRLPLVIAVLFVLLRLAGWGSAHTALLVAPFALAGSWALARDPWLAHRLLTGLAPTLAAAGALGLGVGHALRARGRVSGEDLRRLTLLAATALVLRALMVSHPAFYYPDLRTHARLVEVVREAGLLAFLRTPSYYIWQHGVWAVKAYGQVHAFPYTPAFHLAFTLLPLDRDALITWLKLAAAVVSVVPLVLVWAMARRLGVPPVGALLMALIPTYTSRLTFAFLPALFGHAWDTALLFWLLGHLQRLRERNVWLAGVALVAASQLAYISGVLNISLLIGILAALEASRPEPDRWRRGFTVLAMGLAASLVSVLVYYRDFLGVVGFVGAKASGAGGGAASHYPVQGWLEVTYARTRDFFGAVYPLLTAGGLAVLLRRPDRVPTLLGAWLTTYFLLLLGRAKVPDVFLHGHETLLLTPLVCLASGVALSRLWARGRWGRGAAVIVLIFLAWRGFLAQWNALALQLGNAR